MERKKSIIKGFLFLFLFFILGGKSAFCFENNSEIKSNKVKEIVTSIEKNTLNDSNFDNSKSSSQKNDLNCIPNGNTKKLAKELKKGYDEGKYCLDGR